MDKVTDLHIAESIEHLERLAWPEKLLKGKNPQVLDNAIKTLYKEILRENSDQEKCFILCLRYLHVITRLCKINDEKFTRIKYGHEISRIEAKTNELRPILERRYKEEYLKKKKIIKQENSIAKIIPLPAKTKEQPLFPDEFISVRQLHKAIQDNVKLLIVDIRPESDYLNSKIKFVNEINVPEDILEPGLSANVVGSKLDEDKKKIWDVRDSFILLVFLDWNSGSENIICSKLNHLRASVVEWDGRRQYKQHPVILNGGFKDFFETYPLSVTNVHVNLIRSNEDIDELLELDSISYPEANVSVMHLKEFTIEDLEESINVPEELEEESDEKIDDVPEADLVPARDAAENKANGSPKGGGAVVDKPAIGPENNNEEIRKQIEEQRLRLLAEARNRKNKPLMLDNNSQNPTDGPEGGDSPVPVRNIQPPPVRRDTKPNKVEIPFWGWCGLVNIKNTCYMNTAFQCLKCIPVIRHLVHLNYGQYITRRPPQIIKEFANVIRVLCEGTETDKKIFRPSSLYEVVCKLDPIYKKGNHEDCMEFFLFLFNHLNDDFAKDITKKSIMTEREKAWYAHLQGRTSIWVDLFYHQFQCTKICQVCNLQANSYETDNTLMLPVPVRSELKMVNLKELIHEYLEDNQILDYKCSRCQQMRVINKKSVVVEPEILVIVLKRYYQDEYQETRKNNILVDFDPVFSFGNFDYKLYSVAQHRGTMDHGHYFAHGILGDNVWAELNDERTSRFESDRDSIRGSACAFFYCKVTKTSKL